MDSNYLVLVIPILHMKATEAEPQPESWSLAQQFNQVFSSSNSKGMQLLKTSKREGKNWKESNWTFPFYPLQSEKY
jgi:hypothetical protein